MADGRQQAGARLAGAGVTARLAAGAAALAVVLLGLRAAVPAAHWGEGPWRQHAVPVALAVEGLFAVLAILLEVRRRRDPAPGQPAAGLRGVLRALLYGVLVAIPVLLLFGVIRKPKPRAAPQAPPVGRLAHRSSPPVRAVKPTELSGTDVSAVLYALLALVVLAAVVAAVLIIRHRVRTADWRDAGLEDEEEPQETLRRAVASGTAALREADDARQAIIACYVAMEGSLARAGAVRDAAETPDELLARAAAAGLAAGDAPGRLTALFYEARFSTHPLPPAARGAARTALGELAAALGDLAAPESADPAAPARPDERANQGAAADQGEPPGQSEPPGPGVPASRPSGPGGPPGPGREVPS